MRRLVLGYLAVTLFGAALLSLPISTTAREFQNPIDALFVAVSGISTSGLSVVDIGTYYTVFGQIVLIALFQIGGLGYMSIVFFFVAMFGIKTPLHVDIVAIDSVSGADLHEIRPFFIFIIVYTFVCEAGGALILMLVFMENHAPAAAAYSGIFHSISAFCTAGFSIYSDSLMRYHGDLTVNIVINTVSLLGGIGFIVCYDLFKCAVSMFGHSPRHKLSLHSKIILVSTPILIIVTTIIVYFSEKWDPAAGIPARMMDSLFQTISASTTDGYNSMDIGAMSDTSLLTFIVLMFTGAAPGSTGGGIKISTLIVIVVFLFYQLADRDGNVNLFRRQLPARTIQKAFSIFMWFMVIMIIDAMILMNTEKGGFLRILFEIVSALGNTGLSTGITSSLTVTGRIVLSLTMFIGRVGPLAFGLSLLGEQKQPLYQLPEEDVLVG